MYDFATDEMRTYAPAERENVVLEGYPQLAAADTGWTEEERNTMRLHGYDSMDMLRAWLN